MEWPDGLTYRPIEAWPGELTRNRRLSPFRAPMKSTVTQLRKELGGIRARNAVLQIALSEGQFRIDGAPRAQAVPDHPGVILSLETPDGAIAFPCDTFNSWQDNLRAIVLTMERLRAIDRYGVTKRGEQYRGWKAIEARPASMFTSVENALATLATIAGLSPRDDPKTLLRIAQRATHPDHGGDRGLWDRVTAAGEYLRVEGIL
jgi:hypothetical protein